MKKEAKKSFAKFVNSLFAFVLVVGLMPTWALRKRLHAMAGSSSAGTPKTASSTISTPPSRNLSSLRRSGPLPM